MGIWEEFGIWIWIWAFCEGARGIEFGNFGLGGKKEASPPPTRPHSSTKNPKSHTVWTGNLTCGSFRLWRDGPGPTNVVWPKMFALETHYSLLLQTNFFCAEKNGQYFLQEILQGVRNGDTAACYGIGQELH
jgi:hypothetical protein